MKSWFIHLARKYVTAKLIIECCKRVTQTHCGCGRHDDTRNAIVLDGAGRRRKRVELSKRCGKTRHLVVTTANLKFKLHFNPILSDPQKEQVIEITLLSLTLELSLTLLFLFYIHTHTHIHTYDGIGNFCLPTVAYNILSQFQCRINFKIRKTQSADVFGLPLVGYQSCS